MELDGVIDFNNFYPVIIANDEEEVNVADYCNMTVGILSEDFFKPGIMTKIEFDYVDNVNPWAIIEYSQILVWRRQGIGEVAGIWTFGSHIVIDKTMRDEGRWSFSPRPPFLCFTSKPRPAFFSEPHGRDMFMSSKPGIGSIP